MSSLVRIANLDSLNDIVVRTAQKLDNGDDIRTSTRLGPATSMMIEVYPGMRFEVLSEVDEDKEKKVDGSV